MKFKDRAWTDSTPLTGERNMDAKHTPEPWMTGNFTRHKLFRADDPTGYVIAEFPPRTDRGEADSERAVACVNAFAGHDPASSVVIPRATLDAVRRALLAVDTHCLPVAVHHLGGTVTVDHADGPAWDARVPANANAISELICAANSIRRVLDMLPR